MVVALRSISALDGHGGESDADNGSEDVGCRMVEDGIFVLDLGKFDGSFVRELHGIICHAGVHLDLPSQLDEKLDCKTQCQLHGRTHCGVAGVSYDS